MSTRDRWLHPIDKPTTDEESTEWRAKLCRDFQITDEEHRRCVSQGLQFGKLPLQTFSTILKKWHISSKHTPVHWLGFTRSCGGLSFPGDEEQPTTRIFPKLNTKHQAATTAILIYLNYVTRFGLSSRLRITDTVVTSTLTSCKLLEFFLSQSRTQKQDTGRDRS